MIYDETIFYKVIRIFGQNSEVYKALQSGERISKLIKASYCKKGFGVTRIREKRMLFEECKQMEENFDKQNQTNLDV